jgi:hypothetical protein
MNDCFLRRIDPMKAVMAMLASVGLSGELPNVARPAIRTLDRFIGHGQHLSDRHELLLGHKVNRGGSTQLQHDQCESANGDHDVQKDLEEAIKNSILFAQPLP